MKQEKVHRQVTLNVREGVIAVDEDWRFDLADYKTAFLKRFGNVVFYATNRGRKEKQTVKNLVYKSKSLNDMIYLVNTNSRWRLKVVRYHR